MFTGFHPEAYWEVVVNEEPEKEGEYPPPTELRDDSLAVLPEPQPLATLDESPVEDNDGSEEMMMEEV